MFLEVCQSVILNLQNRTKISQNLISLSACLQGGVELKGALKLDLKRKFRKIKNLAFELLSLNYGVLTQKRARAGRVEERKEVHEFIGLAYGGNVLYHFG